MQDFGEEKPKKDFMSMNRTFLISCLILILFACDREKNINSDPIPEIPLNITINLAIKAPFLNIPGSFFYEQGGYNGLVVVNDFDGEIKVYDRACSFEPRTGCSKLWVDTLSLQFRCGNYDSFKFVTCCTSKFDFNGNVVNQPAVWPLKKYRTSRSGSLLNIFN